jgi:NAD(P) transhydrogenase subunit alpha
MKVAIPAEADSEPRVGATPDTVKKLKAYADVVVQSGAGLASGVLDSDYEAAGATIAQSTADTLHDADVVLKVRRPTEQELSSCKPGALVLAIMDPYGADDALAVRNSEPTTAKPDRKPLTR